MAGSNAFNNNDSMDINELAALNDDISPELIEQLQQKLSQDADTLNEQASTFDENDDTTLFEEPKAQAEETPSAPTETENTAEQEAEKIEQLSETTPPEEKIQQEDATQQPTDKPAEEVKQTEDKPKDEETKTEKSPTSLRAVTNYDDNFIKKYKAKLDKQRGFQSSEFSATQPEDETKSEEQDINKISNGNITEKTITQAQRNYNDSLDLLDGNVKYSKYVIYIDPQNVDFIEGLTVKERKNLINSILREQDDISITKKKFRKVQAIIKHAIVAVLTITIFIPIIYWAVNYSLEASINNYRRSQTNFQTLYKDHGKINQNRN